MSTKRIRIFAGPNGSGKSSIYNLLVQKGQINLGIFVNADEIEKLLKISGQLNFSSYGINLDIDEFCNSFRKTNFYILSNGQNIESSLRSENNILFTSNIELINSYFAAFITDYIRVAMLDCIDVFTIETVMSHSSKLDYIKLAKSKGYRVYLYFVSTQDVAVNISRVQSRVQIGGHDVPIEKIKKRYINSMANLYDAFILSDRAYVFDNSCINLGSHIWYIEYDKGELTFKSNQIPLWINDYLIKKL